jgi:tetratricopeptide (TPR) repeat protein
MFLHSLRLLKRPLLRSGPRLFRYLTSLPETKDASSIIPILNTIEEKSASSYNDLLKQLALNGRSEQAQTVYDEIFRNHVIKANVDTFSHLMVAYMNDGKYHDSMEIYHELRNYEDRASSLDLRLDSSVYETMIESLTKARPDYKRFEQDQEPIYEYSVADNDSLIVTNVEGDSSPSLLTALTLLNDMRHLEIPATVNIYTSMLQACAEQKDEYVLEKVHRLIRMEPCIDPEIDITNHLLKAYYEIKDIGLVLDIWNVAEETKGFDQTSISVVLKACIESGNLERANHIWSLMEDNMKIQKEDYNRYLDCLLRYGIIEQAKTLLQEGMAKGIADKTSVNIWEKYQKSE